MSDLGPHQRSILRVMLRGKQQGWMPMTSVDLASRVYYDERDQHQARPVSEVEVISSALRRLEKRGLVTRVVRLSSGYWRWQLTNAGVMAVSRATR